MREEIAGSPQKLLCSSSSSQGIRKSRNWYSNIFRRIMLLMERGNFAGFFWEALKQTNKNPLYGRKTNTLLCNVQFPYAGGSGFHCVRSGVYSPLESA